MIVYNITVKVDAAVAAEWLRWLREMEAPESLATGCFYDYRLFGLPELHDADGPTYAVQYHARTRADYDRYLQQFAARFQQQAAEKWGSRVLSFGTLMEALD